MIFLSPIRKKNRKMFGALAINSLLFPVFSYAALSNITIDDQYGDAVTGQTPTYVPNEIGIWAQGATCQICAAKPDVSQAFEHTWHDASQKLGETDQRSIQINFTGIDFILTLFESLIHSQYVFSDCRVLQIFTYLLCSL